MGQVQLKGVHKRFGTQAVIRGVDLTVEDGEFMVFVGPSGCGKSTLLRMVAGLEDIDEGELLIDGQAANHIRPADRGVAMVFQSYALYPHMTVAENMGFALRMAGVPRREREAQVGRAAEVLRISELLGRYPKALSGGQRQRVAIGRAIVRQPKVFLFDEPLSNLDAALRVDMRIELTRLHQELGTTMVYVTHDQVEAMTMGDRIAVFHSGQVAQLGAPMALYRRPANLFVAGFLGTPRINLLARPDLVAAEAPSADAQQLWAQAAGGALPGVATLGIRPEDLQLRPAGQGVPASVVLAEHLGDSSILHLRVAGVPELLRLRAAADQPALGPGQSVGLQVDAAAVLRFDAHGQGL